ncbi:MAG: 30S ribosomal protein S11 [Candidatus Jacksonbacteria bacterium RIFOXYA2_FULL_44_7]|uniref:Small ribosomal subunit protein uS11 n=1 Tax=Candidatus Jacksonbacteria bacterium RIFCSPLOWO2_02_FULL_44_20 TaxID=1798460 RepID=A0A1G2ABQ7_9BACT|nr:MAG: Ribosomal protein S11 [Parcubacteria group bacterium GW2011_GWC2_44_17]KKT50237.1 MAG: Ribosomal protein S11 [Parcubacteria group bacterium GW2011_GWF2_44_17]OGY71235.1 MAG: 30S ribosomal protein S11 [Candidatus Jacksonbacteria bacterium RIFCSPHIGHO2_12_FULL_44_12]OGY71694.1 MAG: 30S ribosomal protein S11 [Candidatus Jacksonbacteria bacterium RIFCSPHIGHO2_02_FULL_44_25]OGY73480.1 MAG: 30S ribosomal protein S11 [Candidatus Jacksonbacteria bacterium RIFCSPLOWO2_02_FULL_44_20]OGY74070.1 M
MAKKREVQYGRVHIKATYNNTLITVTDPLGNALAWSGAGLKGFKGPRKATPYAASVIANDILQKIKPFNMKMVDVFVQGIGHGRESAIRTLNSGGLKVGSIRDVTPIPHNGPRQPKPRRV